MKTFSLFNRACCLTILLSSCTYTPPVRNYVLANSQYPLIKHANSVEFVIAKSVFDATGMKETFEPVTKR